MSESQEVPLSLRVMMTANESLHPQIINHEVVEMRADILEILETDGVTVMAGDEELTVSRKSKLVNINNRDYFARAYSTEQREVPFDSTTTIVGLIIDPEPTVPRDIKSTDYANRLTISEDGLLSVPMQSDADVNDEELIEYMQYLIDRLKLFDKLKESTTKAPLKPIPDTTPRGIAPADKALITAGLAIIGFVAFIGVGVPLIEKAFKDTVQKIEEWDEPPLPLPAETLTPEENEKAYDAKKVTLPGGTVIQNGQTAAPQFTLDLPLDIAIPSDPVLPELGEVDPQNPKVDPTGLSISDSLRQIVIRSAQPGLNCKATILTSPTPPGAIMKAWTDFSDDKFNSRAQELSATFINGAVKVCWNNTNGNAGTSEPRVLFDITD